MSDTRLCPECNSEIPADAPMGLCPKCLLKEGQEQPSAKSEPETLAHTPPGGFAPPSPEALRPLFPSLEILELLGKGGMGAVYKARQPGLDRLVAIKILPPELTRDSAFIDRFKREAKALARLGHPNIIGIHDFGQAGGYCYILMEYVDGVNLRQALRSGELKPAEALKIVPQICDALQFAHDEGIVHRDIKPENILLDKKGRVKIADFGLAKLLDKNYELSLTGTQQVMGTLHYMAPEQYLGARDVDHRADIYSLGVTFYEMLTGELPIGRFAPPSKKVQVDVRLDEVVLRSLEREPEQRYQHASDIKTEVETITRAPAAPTSQPAAPPMDEHPLLKGTRFWMTPQPGYGKWVGIPMLVLTALYLLTAIGGVVMMTMFFDGPQWITGLLSCGGGVMLGVLFIVLHIVWLVMRRLSQGPQGDMQPFGPPVLIRRFTTSDSILTRDGVRVADDAWFIDVEERQTVRLFEVEVSNVDQCVVGYHAKIKTKGLVGKAYLEMWCRLPGRGEFFSKGLHQTVSGTTDWASYEIPFLLKKGERPNLIKLNLVVEGEGRIWLKDIELSKTPLGPPEGTSGTGPSQEKPARSEPDTRVTQLRSRVSFLYSVLLPAIVLTVVYLIAVTAAGVGLPLVMERGGPNHALETTQTMVLFIGGLSVAGISVFLFCAWLVRKLLEPPIIDEVMPANVLRPWLVPIIAVINLLVALFFVFIAAGDYFFPGDVPKSVQADPKLHTVYDAWLLFEVISGYLLGALWFAAAIGLLLWQEWGRRLTVWIAIVLLVIFVVEVPAYVRFAFIPVIEEAQQLAPDPGEQALAVAFVFLVMGATIVVGLAYLILELVYFTRRRVVWAFLQARA